MDSDVVQPGVLFLFRNFANGFACLLGINNEELDLCKVTHESYLCVEREERREREREEKERVK